MNFVKILEKIRKSKNYIKNFKEPCHKKKLIPLIMGHPIIIYKNISYYSSRAIIKQSRGLISAIARFKRINAIKYKAGIALLKKNDKIANLIFKYKNILINSRNQNVTRNFLKFRLYKRNFQESLNIFSNRKNKKDSNVVNKITLRVKSPFSFLRKERNLQNFLQSFLNNWTSLNKIK